MPKTVIKVKTFMCPNGLGNPNAECRFHRAVDNMPENGKCPTCKLELRKATDDEDRITLTIIGEEEIESEIENKKFPVNPNEDVDVSTEAKKNAYRARRRDDMANAIAEARKVEDV